MNNIPYKLNKADYASVDELFTEWKIKHQQETDEEYKKYQGKDIPKISFLPDGIIDNDQFVQKKKEKKSILLIAKEAYWFSEDYSYEKKLENAVDTYFWHREVSFGNVKKTMFSNRLSMLANAFYSNDYCTVNKDHKGLQSAAVINLNKRGGFAYCYIETLEGYVKHYCNYIRKEIELINPDVIICCGKDVRWLIDSYVVPSDEIKVYTVSHPSYFALSDVEYLHQFECSVNDIEWTYSKNKAHFPHGAVSTKGIMFDTNKTYSETATFDMLTSEKISAYGRAGRYIDSFNNGDYVFYYVKGLGAVAAGEICSEMVETEYFGSEEKYKMVKLITPKKIPKYERELMNITPSEIKKLFNRGFYFASTIKTPYLSEEQCLLLISELKKRYGEIDDKA